MFVIEFLFCATTALRHGGTFFKTSFLINFRCSITIATTYTTTRIINYPFNQQEQSTYYFPYQPAHTVSSLHLSVRRFHQLCLP